MHIIIEIEYLLLKGRIVGKNTRGVVIYRQSFFYRFDGDRFTFVGDYPVELRDGHIASKRRVGNADARQDFAGFFYACAAAQKPRDKFKLREICFARNLFGITGVPDKIKTCHSESLFVDRVVVKRETVRDMGNAYHCVVAFAASRMAERKRIITRRYRDLLPV